LRFPRSLQNVLKASPLLAAKRLQRLLGIEALTQELQALRQEQAHLRRSLDSLSARADTQAQAQSARLEELGPRLSELSLRLESLSSAWSEHTRSFDFRERLTELEKGHRSLLERVEARLRGLLSWGLRDSLVDEDRKARVAFIVQEPSLLDLTLPIFEALRDGGHSRPLLYAIPHGTAAAPEATERNYRNLCEELDRRRLPYLEAYDSDGRTELVPLRALRPDYVFLQTPYCEQRPPGLSASALARFTQVLYVPYGFMLAASEELQYELPFYRDCYRIFLESQHRKEEFQARGHPSEKFIVSGLPKLDIYLRATTAPAQAQWRLPRESGTRRVIWAPHWSFRWVQGGRETEGYSRFLVFRDVFLRLLTEYPGLDLLIRPHPMLFDNLVRSGLMSEGEVLAYKARIAQAPNAQLLETGDYFSHFQTSDALITDGVSFLAEYLPTSKPLLYTPNPKGPGLNPTGQRLVQHDYTALTESELEAFLRDVVFGGKDPLMPLREQTRQQELFLPAGGSGRFIADHLHQDWAAS